MAKQTKTNAMRMLERAKIAYRAHAYGGEDFKDGVTVAGLLGEPVERVYKTLVTVGASGAHYVFVIPVAKELQLKAAARAVGEKSVAMLPSARITEVTGYIKGGCSPVGMKKQFVTVVDEAARTEDEIYVSAGRRGEQISLAPDDLCRVSGAHYAAVAE